MRPLFAVIIATIILGGVQAFMQARNGVRAPRNESVEQLAEGGFSVEITLTFDAGPDPFALESTSAPALVVQFRGQELLRHTDDISAGQSLLIDDVKNVVAGKNGFFIKATPKDDRFDVARAVRVQVLRDGEPLADETLWSEPGRPIEDEVIVEVDKRQSFDSGHDHGRSED